MKDIINIETIEDLQNAVDGDAINHTIKDLAELFINAMNDWPTFNQTKICDFVMELKDFYGNPLTLEKIDNKKLELSPEHNVWRIEAGSSIAEMIEQSNLFLRENDFDKIIQQLIEYYKGKKPAHNNI